MSLVEQTIARLKKQQAKPLDRPPSNRSPHGTAPAPSTDFEDTASLAKRIPVDYAALRLQGYFPEQERDRQFADQYRRIKRPLVDKALAGAGQVGEPRSIMVTSALPGDGKTFTSINLALSMALERDVSVLLVDADVAKRHVSGIFGLTGMAGLVDILLDENLEPESLIVPTTTRGLSILPAGKRVDGPAELLSSTRMRTVLGTLCSRNSRRIVLLDSPPLLVTNEGRSLVKIAGQVCLVVRSGATPRPAIQAALELFNPEQAGGVVLNDAPGVNSEEYYAYGYGTTYGADGAQT
jgi:protein-tyrosine kinase